MTCFQYHSQPPRHPGRLCSCSAVLPAELYPGQTSQNPPGAGALLVTGKRKNGWNEPVAPIVLSGWTKPKLVSGFNPTPLKNMKVSCDGYPQYIYIANIWKNKKCSKPPTSKCCFWYDARTTDFGPWPSHPVCLEGAPQLKSLVGLVGHPRVEAYWTGGSEWPWPTQSVPCHGQSARYPAKNQILSW